MNEVSVLGTVVYFIELIEDSLFKSATRILHQRAPGTGWTPNTYKQRGLPPSIKEVKAISQYLNDSHTKYDTIHVAGTNGKGSVCLKLANICTKMNDYYPSVGLLVSPPFKNRR
eukprot:389480_1